MKNRILWAIHNILAHPLMEILSWFRINSFGTWLHDVTVPKDI